MIRDFRDRRESDWTGARALRIRRKGVGALSVQLFAFVLALSAARHWGKQATMAEREMEREYEGRGETRLEGRTASLQLERLRAQRDGARYKVWAALLACALFGPLGSLALYLCVIDPLGRRLAALRKDIAGLVEGLPRAVSSCGIAEIDEIYGRLA